MSCYLGLDASTQSLSAIVIDTDSSSITLNETVNFGADLPDYHSPHGSLPNDDPLVKQSDPLMWVEALDLLLQRCRSAGFDWQTIDGVSVSGQQHGSVYLNARYADINAWDPGCPLKGQVQPLLSRAVAPIWMDSSTTVECREIAAAAGGDQVVTRISGSRTIERFTGPQIRRFYKLDPDGYGKTRRIHLVSSFMTWLLRGSDVPIDHGDGAGMNLLDLASGEWNERLLEATAPKLRDKLPPAVPSTTCAGFLADYFVTKYGFKEKTPLLVGSGDNPNSLVGMGAIQPGTAVISLGTSDTCFAAMSEPRTDPNGYGHVFGNPAGGYMCLIAFKNGSLAREEVRQEFGLNWEQFAAGVLQRTEPGNHGNFMLYYYAPEITPRILEPVVERFGSPSFCQGSDADAAARAILESQAISMQLHSQWIGETPKRILVTGGASRNPAVLQVLADVFQADLAPLAVSNSAGLGAAMRAANQMGGHAWESLFACFSQPDASRTARPRRELDAVYRPLREAFAEKQRRYIV